MPPPVHAVLLKTRLRGQDRGGQRRALGQVVGDGRIENGQGADAVDAAALPRAEVVDAVATRGAQRGVAADRAVRDGHGRANVAGIADAPPPALAPGLPPSASLPVKVLFVIDAEPVLAKFRSKRRRCEDVGIADDGIVGRDGDGLVGVEGAVGDSQRTGRGRQGLDGPAVAAAGCARRGTRRCSACNC